jgi:hypothetical protein
MTSSRPISLLCGLGAAVLFAVPALAQAQPGGNGAPPDQGQATGADQVVGLFGATCLHFAGDVAGLRGFLSQQKAPQMPQQARDAFLAGRRGQAFDVSYQNVRLALVSLDDGGCEAVADQANPAEVLSTLQQAAQENQIVLTPLGGQPDKRGSGIQHSAYSATLAGRMMHVLVSTAPTAPQAVLTLAPK